MRSLSHLLRQHRSLLNDDARMSAYAEAIAQTVRPDDVVLDLGSGTGILAMLAARAGARRVFAIEAEHVVDAAAMLARQNRVNVEWFHAASKEVELPERATLLITETLGNLGFDEGILGSVIDAKRRLLTPDARILPQSVTLIAAPVEAPELYEKRVGWWNERRQGMDFSAMRTFASNQVWNADFATDSLLESPSALHEVLLPSVDSMRVSGSAEFMVRRDGILHGFAGWFVTRLAGDITLSNGPPLQTPNWRQGFFPLEHSLPVRLGTRLRLDLDTDDGKEWRWRGTVESDPPVWFDQMTQFGFAPCTKVGER